MQKNDLRKCKKIIISLISVFLLWANLTAYSGMLSGEKKLRVAKTRWFDIIYPARCEESASILYEKADGVYDEVTAQYGLSPSFRIPVVITPAVDTFNAFWTAVPYNHIAIYDTGASGSSELAVFSETLLSTFRHELTHAVTYNMKNAAWRITGKIFGDCVVPGMLTVTTGMAEGATLTSESAAGEGRLNNEYSKHFVKQAKIEGKFPSYHDVSGASDVAPGGSPYYFNGAFHEWLQEKYGMAAYAEFWYRVVNGKNFTIAGAFKKSFGIKLKKAWAQFEEEYEVPVIGANPVEAGLVRDFFQPDSKSYSRMNDAGSLYSSLSAAGGRLVWMDSFGGRVFAAEAVDKLDLSEGSEITVNSAPREKTPYRQIFSLRGLNDVRLSNDGRFLAASYTSGNGAGATARVKLYDFESAGLFTIEERGLKEAVVLKSGGGWYLLAQKYMDQHYSIVVRKLLFDDSGRRVRGTEEVSELVLGAEINPYAFTPLDDGSFAWLKKEGLSQSLCISSINGSLLKEYAFPQGMFVHSLSYNDGTFLFSYVEKGTMPRLGSIQISSGLFSLDARDISGGVFEPVFWKDQVVYIGEFYRQSRLLCLDLEGGAEVESQSDAAAGAAVEAVADENAGEPDYESTLPSQPYNPFPYITRGIIIPVSNYSTDYFAVNAESTSDPYNIPLGLTYITANPWTEGSSDLYTFTAGWNLKSQALGMALTINKGTATSLLQSSTVIKSEFDKHGWKQSGVNFTLSSFVEAGRYFSIGAANASDARIGNLTPENGTIYYMLQNVSTLQLSNVRRTGPGRFEYGGFTVGVTAGARYDSDFNENPVEYFNATAIGAVLKLRIPHLLPFESKYGYTCNLPLRINTALLPSSSSYGLTQPKTSPGRAVLDASAETTLFSIDVQKAVPVITALYINDFNIAAGYSGTLAAGLASESGFQNTLLKSYFKSIKEGKGYYLDSVYIRTTMEFTPNIGLFARPAYKMGLYSTFGYVLHSTEPLKPAESLRLTLGLDIDF